MKPCRLTSAGLIVQADGSSYPLPDVDAAEILVPHLAPRVETYELGGLGEIGVLIRYSCHCWTSKYDEALHDGGIRIMDRGRARAFDPARYAASLELPELMRDLPHKRIYATRGDRNYGSYDASRRDADGLFYTAYFALKARKGLCGAAPYSFRLFVESAYPKAQQEPGRATSLRAIIGRSRTGIGANGDSED
ncbi:hypothetical protein [Stappia indica]|uniref:hypothetical protein n=1 Tax=Stappia indica TaxID=538381 RepID=UPI001CD632F2|nr:hypothetical protein [Stappia indica]MCA1297165.1 hypothetical protein [Stappia indica]